MTEQPNTQTLETLLRRWAELEPERCIAQDDGDLTLEWQGHFNVDACSLRNGLDPWDTALVQGAVQEAIEARGWIWDLGTAPPRRGGNYPDCMHAAGVFRVRGDMDHNACGPTPAAAILSAYLQALEAQR